MRKGDRLLLFSAVLFYMAAAVLAVCFNGYLFASLGTAGIVTAGLFLRFLHKKGKIVVIVLVLLGLIVFNIFEIPVIAASGGEPEREADYIIVLGALAKESGPSVSLRERLDAALEYLNKHPDTVAVLSGGQGDNEPCSEAECMEKWLLGHGIPEERLILEDRSTSTEENIAFSLKKIGPEHAGPIGIASSEYHLRRAVLIAGEQGIDAFGIPAHTGRPLLRTNYFIREACAMMYRSLFSR